MFAQDSAKVGCRHQPEFDAKLPERDGGTPGFLRRERLGELLRCEEACLT
jgi:hypothetical protein